MVISLLAPDSGRAQVFHKHPRVGHCQMDSVTLGRLEQRTSAWERSSKDALGRMRDGRSWVVGNTVAAAAAAAGAGEDSC